MIASKFARTTFNGFLISKNTSVKIHNILFRNASSQGKEGFFRRAARAKIAQETIKEAAEGATKGLETPINVGRAAVAGASLIGLGSLAFYGLGLSNKTGFIDRSSVWPEYVKQRIRTTYEYFGAGLGFTAASAYAVTRSPTLMNLAMKNSLLSIFASMALVIGTGALVRSIPYDANSFGSKQLAWALHAGTIGAFVAPLALLGGPLLVRAAWYTAGVIGGLSVIAASAPSEKFLNMGGPLAIGLGVVFASSLAGMFYPPTNRLGLSLYSISIYGGLILFSMFLLYDTQKIVYKAENSMHFDPVNESISIYLDAVNIFIRIAMILAHGGNKRK